MKVASFTNVLWYGHQIDFLLPKNHPISSEIDFNISKLLCFPGIFDYVQNLEDILKFQHAFYDLQTLDIKKQLFDWHIYRFKPNFKYITITSKIKLVDSFIFEKQFCDIKAGEILLENFDIFYLSYIFEHFGYQMKIVDLSNWLVLPNKTNYYLIKLIQNYCDSIELIFIDGEKFEVQNINIPLVEYFENFIAEERNHGSFIDSNKIEPSDLLENLQTKTLNEWKVNLQEYTSEIEQDHFRAIFKLRFLREFFIKASYPNILNWNFLSDIQLNKNDATINNITFLVITGDKNNLVCIDNIFLQMKRLRYEYYGSIIFPINIYSLDLTATELSLNALEDITIQFLNIFDVTIRDGSKKIIRSGHTLISNTEFCTENTLNYFQSSKISFWNILNLSFKLLEGLSKSSAQLKEFHFFRCPTITDSLLAEVVLLFPKLKVIIVTLIFHNFYNYFYF